jgi:hypothetical protein
MLAVSQGKLMKVLRLHHNSTYSVSVTPVADSSSEEFNGVVVIHFACDPARAHFLAMESLSVLRKLQRSPPTTRGIEAVRCRR